MNDNQVLEQLSETDAYAPGTLMPALAWGRETALSEIERRMGMEPRESTKQPTITSAPTSEDQLDITSPPTRTRQQTPRWRGPRVALGAVAATAIVVLAVFAIASLTDSDGPEVGSAPSEAINAYIDAYNAGDINGIMTLFTEQSVITGHPFGFGGVTGIEAIKSLQEMDLRVAATENAYTISNVQVVGNTVTWDHVWIKVDGHSSCKQGNNAVVENGKIISWAFGTGKTCD